MPEESWEVIVDNWTSQSTLAVCPDREVATQMAFEYADRRPGYWTVRVDLASGERQTLRDGRTGQYVVRIRQVIHEPMESRRRPRWGEYDLPTNLSWPAKLGITLVGLLLLRILTESVLPNAGFASLAWPARLLFLVWVGALWTGGGRMRDPE